MAKKAVTPERGARSQAVRDFLKQQPKANIQEVQSGLQQQGINASASLISKIKYSGKKRRRSPSVSKTENGTEQGGKAQSAPASPSQTSPVRKTMRGRNGGRKKVSGSPSGSFTAHDLLAAKKLVAQVGGIEAAQNAVAVLKKLSES